MNYQITITKKEDRSEYIENQRSKMGLTNPEVEIFKAGKIHPDDAIELLQHLHDLNSKRDR